MDRCTFLETTLIYYDGPFRQYLLSRWKMYREEDMIYVPPIPDVVFVPNRLSLDDELRCVYG